VGKACVEDYEKVYVWEIIPELKERYENLPRKNAYIDFCVKLKNSKKEEKINVYLPTTDCHFGGFRYWFGCPSCGNRVATLFHHTKEYYEYNSDKLEKSPWLSCRDCLNLAYESQQISAKLFKLRKLCEEYDKAVILFKYNRYHSKKKIDLYWKMKTLKERIEWMNIRARFS